MEEEVPVIPNGTLDRHSVSTSHSSRSGVVYRDTHRPFSMWRPSTYINAVVQNRRSNNGSVIFSETWSESVSHSGKESVTDYLKDFRKKGRWNTLVTVMVVQAKSLPQTSEKSSMYCKIRLGSEMYKTKSVSRSPQPEWKEQFQLHIHRDHLLKVSLWEKDKQKNFMGSCVVDLARLDKERTHELHLELDDGFGQIQLCVTMCTVRDDPPFTIEDTPDAHLSYKKTNDMKLVGELHVTAVAARGLYSKPNAFCTLELHNQSVQTHRVNYSSEPVWNKRYVFDVYDITSTLDVNIKDSSIRSSFRSENLGKVSIPLYRVRNGELRWYALKDKNRRNSAKGNHPRILLQMSIVWNPVKAALRLFSPKEVKYLEKPRKFDLDVVYKNTVFIKELFDIAHAINDAYMPQGHFYKSESTSFHKRRPLLRRKPKETQQHLFEWDNQELSALVLTAWLVFWFYFKPWTIPLLLIAPFVFFFIAGRASEENMLEMPYKQQDNENLLNCSERHDQSLPGKIKALPDISLNILANIELVTSLAERLYNLVTFKVPFLSYVAMIMLLGASFAIYFIPFNYMMMGLGLYKFTRKFLNPNRTLNNELVDFITRIPDNEIWKDWNELSVPEPVQKKEHKKVARSVSDTAAADFT